MKHFNANHEPLFRRVNFKLVAPDGKRSSRVVMAPPNQGFPIEAISGIAKQVFVGVKEQFPDHVFRIVRIGATEFNIVCDGQRSPIASPYGESPLVVMA